MMDAREEVVLTLTNEIDSEEATFGMGPFKASTRRLVMIGHFAFRSLALLTYLFGSWFLNSFIIAFVFILINLSIDFWFVKNISGRVLVGMRWFSQTADDGTTEWLFDCRPTPGSESAGQSGAEATITMTRRERLARAEQSRASYVFWTSLIVTPVLWGLFVCTSLFSLHPWWAMVAAIGVTMTGTNLYAYGKCRMSGMSDGMGSLISTLRNKVSPRLVTDLLSNLNQSARKVGATVSTDGARSDSDGRLKPTIQV